MLYGCEPERTQILPPQIGVGQRFVIRNALRVDARLGVIDRSGTQENPEPAVILCAQFAQDFGVELCRIKRLEQPQLLRFQQPPHVHGDWDIGRALSPSFRMRSISGSSAASMRLILIPVWVSKFCIAPRRSGSASRNRGSEHRQHGPNRWLRQQGRRVAVSLRGGVSWFGCLSKLAAG